MGTFLVIVSLLIVAIGGIVVQPSIGRSVVWDHIPGWIWPLVACLIVVGLAYAFYLSNDFAVFP